MLPEYDVHKSISDQRVQTVRAHLAQRDLLALVPVGPSYRLTRRVTRQLIRFADTTGRRLIAFSARLEAASEPSAARQMSHR